MGISNIKGKKIYETNQCKNHLFRSVSFGVLSDKVHQNIKMWSLTFVLVICAVLNAHAEEKKPAKAIAVLGLSDKVFGSMRRFILRKFKLS